MCFSSLFLCKIMASHFHIFRSEDIKIEKKRWSRPYILMLRCRILLSSSMVKVIEVWKTDFQQRRTKIQFKNGEVCDLEVIRVCWPCPHLPMIWIWWRSKVIKAVLGNFRSLTLNAQYLTLGAKIQNSTSCNFCVWF